MKFFASLQQRLGFTHNEVKVVLFLSAMFLVGLGIRGYEAATEKDTTLPFDYTSIDSEFVARSQALASLTPSTPATGAVTPASHRKPALKEGGINVNSASAAELVQLPGIGASYAERIVAYRNEHGPFATVNELEHVKGIGKKRLEQIRPFLTVGETRKDSSNGNSKSR